MEQHQLSFLSVFLRVRYRCDNIPCTDLLRNNRLRDLARFKLFLLFKSVKAQNITHLPPISSPMQSFPSSLSKIAGGFAR